jgi:hypothetical protein
VFVNKFSVNFILPFIHGRNKKNITQRIKRVAEQIADSEMIFKVTSEDFVENALYHSACITRYLLRNIKTEWILIA